MYNAKCVNHALHTDLKMQEWVIDSFQARHALFYLIAFVLTLYSGRSQKGSILGGGPFRPLHSSKTSHRSDKRKMAFDRPLKDLHILQKHFRVRSMLRSPEVINDKMFWNLFTYITFELRKIET